jgi:hypothetical protein
MSGCKFVSTTQPRVVPGRHMPDCTDEACTSCLPCTESHCQRCTRVHSAAVCVECTDRTRTDLHRIMDLCLSLPIESHQRGVNSAAFMLDGPMAVPEDWRRRALLAMLGRVCECPSRGMVCPTVRGRICPDAAYLEDCRDEPHALTTLGDWDEQWRTMLAHETEVPLSLGRAFSYLDMQLSYMADQPWSEFDQFSREIRACRVYLERVLSDDDKPTVTDVPCLDCSRNLVKVFGRQVADDHWTCPRKSCARVYTEAEFNLAKLSHLGTAGEDSYVRVSDALGAIKRPEATLRAWITREHVRTRREPRTGVILVSWPDVWRMHEQALDRDTKKAG